MVNLPFSGQNLTVFNSLITINANGLEVIGDDNFPFGNNISNNQGIGHALATNVEFDHKPSVTIPIISDDEKPNPR